MTSQQYFPPSPSSSQALGINERYTKTNSSQTQQGFDPSAEAEAWLRDQGWSSDQIQEYLHTINRIQIPLEPDGICLQKLKASLEHKEQEEQGQPNMQRKRVSKVKSIYELGQSDLDKKWNDFRWDSMVDMSALPPDALIAWNDYVSSFAHNSALIGFMSTLPCVVCCWNHGHKHKKHKLKDQTRRNANSKNRATPPTLRRSARIEKLERLKQARKPPR